MPQPSALGLALDLALMTLLAACLFFCWRLDQRLSRLRAGQDGMREAVAELAEASRHAEAAVRGLRLAAGEAGRELQGRIDEARGLSERLGRRPGEATRREGRY